MGFLQFGTLLGSGLWTNECKLMTCIPILLYHNVGNDFLQPNMFVSVEQFESQMKYLKNHSYYTVFLDEVLEHIKGKNTLPDKTIAITFDDGYIDNFTHAFPIMKKYQIKATIFINTSKMVSHGERKKEQRSKFISWDQALEMQESGLIDIQSHGHRHVKHIGHIQEMNENLMKSKMLIEGVLKKPCSFISWPFGEFNLASLKQASNCGFLGAVTARDDVKLANGVGWNNMVLERFIVKFSDTIDDFHTKLNLFLNPALSLRAYYLWRRCKFSKIYCYEKS